MDKNTEQGYSEGMAPFPETLGDPLTETLAEIARLTSHAGTRPMETPIPGVLIIRGEVPQHQLAAIYEPMIGFVVQGGKNLSIGSRTIHLTAPSYFVVPTDVPASGSVHQGENGAPYVSVALRLNRDRLLDLLRDMEGEAAFGEPDTVFSGCEATPEFIDAWVRLLRLLKRPEDIPALAPAYEREILYRVLRGPQGWRLRQAFYDGGKAPGMMGALRAIRENYARSLDVKPLARAHGMAVTTFHRRFKSLTGLSPIQFQKQLRLLEARKLLAFHGDGVSDAAFKVGYESASQFSREYSRYFGAAPGRDARNLQHLPGARNPSVNLVPY